MDRQVVIRSAWMLLLATWLTALPLAAQPSRRLDPQEQRDARSLAHYVQGLIYEDSDGRASTNALREFATCSELDTGNHRLHAKTATLYLLNGRQDDAIAELEKSCRELPDSWLASIDLATAYQFVGNTNQAIANFKRSLKLDPTRNSVYVTLANLYFGIGQDKRAFDVLADGIDRSDDPEHVRVYCYNRGLEFIGHGESARSLPCFEFVVYHSTAKRSQVFYLMGQLYERLELWREARTSYALASREDPLLPQAYIKLALLQFEEDPEGALKILERAARKLPDDLLLPFQRGRLLSSMERYPEAIKSFEEVAAELEKQPGTALPSEFYLLYGAAYERVGNFTEAERVFADCLARYPDTPEVMNYLAYMWADRGTNLEQALRYVNQALEQEPKNGAYLDTRGWIYYRLGRYAEALIEVQAANTELPDDPTVNDHLGDTYSALGNREKAIAHWEASYRINSENGAVADKLRANGVKLETLVPIPPANASAEVQ